MLYTANNLAFIVAYDWQKTTEIYSTIDGITIEGPLKTYMSLNETKTIAGDQCTVLVGYNKVYNHGRVSNMIAGIGIYTVKYIDQGFVSNIGSSKDGIVWDDNIYGNDLAVIGNKWSLSSGSYVYGYYDFKSTNNPSIIVRATNTLAHCYGAGVFMKYLGDGVAIFLAGSSTPQNISWGPSFSGTYKFVYGHGKFVGVNIDKTTGYVGDVICIDTKGLS
jgi:hypothetical protein